MSLLTDISEDWRHLILAEYAKDTWAAGFIDGTIQDIRYTLVNELIIYKGRIFLVSRSTVRRMIHLWQDILVSTRHTNRLESASHGKGSK